MWGRKLKPNNLELTKVRTYALLITHASGSNKRLKCSVLEISVQIAIRMTTSLLPLRHGKHTRSTWGASGGCADLNDFLGGGVEILA